MTVFWWIALYRCKLLPYTALIMWEHACRQEEPFNRLSHSCHRGDWEELFRGEPLVWSGGMKKLACVMSCLRLVCLDQNTISLFVLCHCLRWNLGLGIRWHFLDSCGVPFEKSVKNCVGTHQSFSSPKLWAHWYGLHRFLESRIGRGKLR